MNNVVCVLKSGGDFTIDDATFVYYGLNRAVGKKVNVICLTDLVQTREVHDSGLILEPLRMNWPGRWSKMELFSPEMEEFRPFLYVDLDTMFLRESVGDFLNMPNSTGFTMLRDLWVPEKSESGLLFLPSGYTWELWNEFVSLNLDKIDPKKSQKDGPYIASKMPNHQKFQDLFPNRICSFKPKADHMVRPLTKQPEGIDIVCFHGAPRPREACKLYAWVRDYYMKLLEMSFSKLDLPIPQPLVPVVNTDATLPKTVEEPVEKEKDEEVLFSVMVPSRGRPNGLLQMISSAKLKAKHKIEFLVYLDSDDVRNYDLEALRRMATVFITDKFDMGRCWNEMASNAKGRYLLMSNDDVVFLTDGWDQRFLKAATAKYPDDVFVGWFNDGSGRDCSNICCFPIIPRKLYQIRGSLVPEYFFILCFDSWLLDLGVKMGRTLYLKDVVMDHRHFAFHKAERDETYKRNRTDRPKLKANFIKFRESEQERALEARRILALVGGK